MLSSSIVRSLREDRQMATAPEIFNDQNLGLSTLEVLRLHRCPQAASFASAMSWSLIRPQSHRKIAWRRLRCVLSGFDKTKPIGFRQPGQTGGRIGGGASILGIYTPCNTADSQHWFRMQIVLGGFLAPSQLKYLSPQPSGRIKAPKVLRVSPPAGPQSGSST